MAPALTIYHNPRCSKSRATLGLLVDKGLSPTLVEYLKQGLTVAEIKRLLDALGMPASQVIRRGEKVYRDHGLNADGMTNDQLIAAIADNPILLERPIVSDGDKAIIGSPPENVLALL